MADTKPELVVTAKVDMANQSINQERQRQSVEHGGVRHEEREGSRPGHRRHNGGHRERRDADAIKSARSRSATRMYRASIEFSLFHVGQRIKVEYEMN